MVDSVLATRGLTKRYGRRNVVDQVTMAVRRGDIYGFLGPNGSGKTTTLRMVLGLIRASSGEVELLGQNPAKAPRSLMRQVGALIEGPGLYPHLSATENLRIVAKLKGLGDEREIQELLATVDLTHVGRMDTRRFSLGMKQRLGIAMALLGRPKLLILDEPTNGLDPEGFREMRSLLRSLVAERGITVLLSSHMLHEVEQIATRVGVIRSGRLLAEATVQDLRQQGERGLEIQVSRPDLAAQLLQERMGLTVQQRPDGLLLVSGGVRPAAVNALLVRNDLEVLHLAEREASLEQIFFDLTGGMADA